MRCPLQLDQFRLGAETERSAPLHSAVQATEHRVRCALGDWRDIERGPSEDSSSWALPKALALQAAEQRVSEFGEWKFDAKPVPRHFDCRLVNGIVDENRNGDTH